MSENQTPLKAGFTNIILKFSFEVITFLHSLFWLFTMEAFEANEAGQQNWI